MGLERITQSSFEIAQLLAKNNQIQKLLYVDLDNVDDAVSENIPVQPNWYLENSYIQVETPIEYAIENETKNTSIYIRLDDLSFHMADDNVAAWGFIDIVTNEDHVLLTKNRSRLLELLKLVVQTLDGKKLSASGEVQISSASFSVYSPSVFGWRMRFSLRETLGKRQAEI